MTFEPPLKKKRVSEPLLVQIPLQSPTRRLENSICAKLNQINKLYTDIHGDQDDITSMTKLIDAKRYDITRKEAKIASEREELILLFDKHIKTIKEPPSVETPKTA